MSVRRNASMVAVGGTLAQIALVVRGIIVARLIGPDNMGVAAAFFAVIAFIDTLSESGADAFLAQQKAVAPERAARTTQLVAVIRGIACGLALLALAVPSAESFGAPEAIGGFLAIAIVPVARGFMSHDLYVQQRHARPRSMMIAEVSSQLLALVLGVGVGWWIGNWWAVVAALLGQTMVFVVVSHLCAENPWRLGFERSVARASFAFGLPLLASSIALFLSQQGDRIMIGVAPSWFGVEYSKSDLGRYAVAASVAILPIRPCVLLLRSAFLPWMIAAEDDLERRRRRRLAFTSFGLIGVAFAIASSTVAGDLLVLLVGERYGHLHLLVATLCTAQAVRLLRFQLNAVALAAGETREIMLGGFLRLVAIGLALPAVVLGVPVEWIAATAIVGELIAVVVSEWRMARLGLGNDGIRHSATAWAVVMISIAGGCAFLTPWLGGFVVLGGFVLVATVGALVLRRTHAELWSQVVRFAQLLWQRRKPA